MRAALAALLLLLLSTPTCLKLGIFAWYEANISYVASTLCENRNRPERHCNGKCYLYKQLAKADGDTHPDRPMLQQLSKFELPAFLMPEPLHLHSFAADEISTGFAYIMPFIKAACADIFHPPD
ncbi:MAG: hypothetical protein JST06_10325 [Bacteroidetes bacterium]|nr:hypothetical protein [Bacteroidota bacterium]MBS1630136.1 hypothetical protein [Bacteroidota bacterium]